MFSPSRGGADVPGLICDISLFNSGSPMNAVSTVGIDFAKNVFGAGMNAAIPEFWPYAMADGPATRDAGSDDGLAGRAGVPPGPELFRRPAAVVILSPELPYFLT